MTEGHRDLVYEPNGQNKDKWKNRMYADGKSGKQEWCMLQCYYATYIVKNL